MKILIYMKNIESKLLNNTAKFTTQLSTILTTEEGLPGKMWGSRNFAHWTMYTRVYLGYDYARRWKRMVLYRSIMNFTYIKC